MSGLEQIREALARLVFDINDITANSTGVAGLHQNGDLAEWPDLLEGGRFEPWLGEAMSQAERVLNLTTPTPVKEPEKGATGEQLETVARAICAQNITHDIKDDRTLDQRVDDEWSDWKPDACAAIAALAATNAGQVEAREALEPFVRHWQPWMDETDATDDGSYNHPDDDEMSCFARVTYGDLRRARAALKANGDAS